MKWFPGVLIAAAAILCFSFSDQAKAQHCENGVCQLGAPVVAMPGPFLGGPVYFAPAIVSPQPAFVSHGGPIDSHNGPNVSHCQPPILYACNGVPLSPPGCLPACRPSPASWQARSQCQRGGSIGLSLTWQRSGSYRGGGRWH